MKGIENKKHSRYKSNYSNVNTEVVLVFYREIKPIGFFFHKELIHIIVEPGNPSVQRWSVGLGPRRPNCAVV